MKCIAILCLVFILVPLTSFAQLPPPVPPQVAAPPPPPPPPPPPVGSGKWWKNSEAVKVLELSEAQITQLETIFLQHQSALSERRSRLLKEEEKLRSMLESDRLDDNSIRAQREAIITARRALEEENSDMTLAMRHAMTSEQWKKLEKLKQASIPAPPAPPPPPTPPAPPEAGAEVYDTKAPGIQNPVPLNNPLPPYSPEARAAKIEGIVILQAVIRKDGTIADVKILRGLGYGLDESAISTVRTKWRFRPGMLNGQPVNVRVNLEISFRLS